jgi:CBS domain containing-hemolysin-like protein
MKRLAARLITRQSCTLTLAAVVIALVYLLLSALGLRAYATVFSGTSPTGLPITPHDVTLGVSYAIAYLAFIVVAPILLIAAAVNELLWLRSGRRSKARNA